MSTGNEAKVPPYNLQFAAAAPTLHTPAPAPDDDAGPAPVIVPAPDPGADDDPGGTGAPAEAQDGAYIPYSLPKMMNESMFYFSHAIAGMISGNVGQMLQNISRIFGVLNSFKFKKWWNFKAKK